MWLVKTSIIIAIVTVLYAVAVTVYVNKNTHIQLKLKHNERYFPWFLKIEIALLAICFWTVFPSVIYLLFFA